jgi:protein-disulfide isomerase
MIKILRAAAFAGLAFATLPHLSAESGITRKQADEILQELRQIRQLLEKPAAPTVNAAAPELRAEPREEAPVHATVSVGDRPFLGSKDAPITIVEFTDYQCPFCRQFHLSTFNELKTNYIDQGKVRFYSKDLPLEFHANALVAAQAARCANDQGQFWKLREIMSTNASTLEMPNIVAWAKNLNLNTDSFQSCVQSGKYKDAVQADAQEARRIGAEGTPAFVIGKSLPDGVDGELLVGAFPYGVFEQKLKALESGR